MVSIVDAQWLKAHLASPNLVVVDPRTPVRYYSGHIKGAVNVRMDRALFALWEGRMVDLEHALGSVGIDDTVTVITYDDQDGQAAATLVWLLEYLGHPDVRLLSVLLRRWTKEGEEVGYKPVHAMSRQFVARPDPSKRADLEEVIRSLGSAKLIDFRSQDEYRGRTSLEWRPGHIPTALNIPWTLLQGGDGELFKSPEALRAIFADAGLAPEHPIVAYCSDGPRACLGYYALTIASYPRVKVYDRSYLEWSRRGDLPVEL